MGVDHEHLQQLGTALLQALGEDPTREGLVDTPRRWADWWLEFMQYDPGRVETTFEAVHTDQMVAVTDIDVWSLCEHHLLPFSATVAIGYITSARVLGLSKFARLAHEVAHRLQLQERLTHELAARVSELTGASGVAVVVAGRHLCMTMRGIRSPATMTTSVMLGRFREDYRTRSEFLALVAGGKR